ncbi:MAG: tryptophan 7-halogenase [Chitinophaga sp.]|uniref:flavin-dependent monooxygenase QhpG n=1 Tax=Chitinophaga sp. TaxID=1869181 RepID=UPI001B0601AB|nr:tryptophan 7-halogenase [Chitinophaga sp.]MBO9732504.1 tryptophan 7-halogenase [Chitinophaga sp.]
MEVYDILIIGAGAAGNCAALRLLSLGYRVALVESSVFPRPQIGESLSPGIHGIFDYLGASNLLSAPHCQHQLPAEIIWESQQPLLLTPQTRGHGVMADRGLLDKDLLQLATSRGLQLFQPARYESSRHNGAHWEVNIQPYGKDALSLRARFILDARGRKAIRQQQRLLTAPSMAAIWAYVPASRMPAHTCVEAIPDGWIWGAPLYDGRYRIITFAAANTIKRKHLHDIYNGLLQQSVLFRQNKELHPLQSCAVTMYAHTQPWQDYRLQLGEAAFAIDPLSSTGVEKAMRCALQAVIAVNTILKGGDIQLAQEFYEDRIIKSVVSHTHWTRQYYAQAWPGTAHCFWQEHGGSYLPEKHISNSFTEKLSSALQEEKPVTPPPAEKAIDINYVLQQLWNGKPMVSPAISYVPSSCVVNDCLEIKTAIKHPNLPGTMAFLETVEIYPLLKMAAHTPTFGSLVTAWSQLMPFQKAAKMAIYLWDKKVLLPQ